MATKFEPGQRIRGRRNHEELGSVEWHSGPVVYTTSGLHVFARDVEAVDDPQIQAPAPIGDLCTHEGQDRTNTTVLIGRNLQLVWTERPARLGAGQTGPAKEWDTRVELRRLDSSYVTTVAIGNVTPGHLMLAMPYLTEQYGHPDDLGLSAGTFEELYEGDDDDDPASG
jgi:hypothetical protein